MIFTFYSYKGGVGRSMALANVAHWLYQRGMDVVLVDWDLEAPGLESFFTESQEELDKIRSQTGVIDLLYAYMRQFPFLPKDNPFKDLPPITDSLYVMKPSSAGPGTLRILSAGWRSGDRFSTYAESVQSFSWAEFYSDYRGEEYFNWFRQQLIAASSQIVLVDSRTGVTEMGGVCTRQLADVVAVLCAPNRQNVEGCLDIVKSFRDDDLKKARGRDLNFVIVPARVDDQDSAGYNKFRDELFVPKVAPFLPKVFKTWKRTSWDLEIPYKTEYSYREGLVAGVPKANEKLDKAYRNLAAHLALFTPESHPLWTACEPELRPLASAAGIEFRLQRWVAADAAFSNLPAELQPAARSVLLRLIDFSPQTEDLDSLRRATHDEFEAPEASAVVSHLLKLSVIAQVSENPSGPSEFELADASFVRNWQRLREWTREDRDFLLRRQDLTEQAAKWRESNSDPAMLWQDSQLATAQRLRDGNPQKLNHLELNFLQACEKEVERRNAEYQRLKDAKAHSEALAALQAEQKAQELAEQTRKAQAESARLQEEQAEAQRLAALQTRRIKFAVASLIILVIAAVLSYEVYSRLDSTQVRAALASGHALEDSDSVSAETKNAWRLMLVASGHSDDAIALAKRNPVDGEKAVRLAETAVWIAHSDQSGAANVAKDAIAVAAEGGIGNGDAYATVLALLEPQKLRPPTADLKVLTSIDGGVPPEATDKLTSFPAFNDARESRLAQIAKLPSDAARFAELIKLASAAKTAQDKQMFDRCIALARSSLKSFSGDSFSSGSMDIAELTRNPDDLKTAVAAIQKASAAERVHDLTRLAVIEPAPDQEAVFEDALRSADTPSVARISQLQALVSASLANSAFSDRARDTLEKRATESGSRNDIAESAAILAAAGDATRSIRLAGTLTDKVDRARTLSQVADELSKKGQKDGVRQASEQVLQLSKSTPKTDPASDAIAGELIHVLPYLYPSPDAKQAVDALNTPAAYLAWAKAAGDSGDPALDKALVLTLVLNQDNSDRQELLAQLGILYAQRGRLLDSNNLARQATSADVKLRIYTAILRYDTMRNHPEKLKSLESDAAARTR